MTACRSPLPPWWTAFETWRAHGGIPADRPTALLPKDKRGRVMIPAWAWGCYRERHPKPKPVVHYGILAGSGWFVREPSGGSETEKIAAAKAAGFAYLMLNVRDYPGDRFDSWRIIADKAGLPCVPVGRVYDDQVMRLVTAQEIADETVQMLLRKREDWNAPGVAFNIENEAETVMSPTRLNMLTSAWRGSMAVLVDYRGYVDQSGYHGPNWAPVADRAVGMIECFDSTATKAIDPAAGISRALLAGFKRVVPLLGVNAGRDAYGPLVGPRAGYSIDTVAPEQIAGWMT